MASADRHRRGPELLPLSHQNPDVWWHLSAGRWIVRHHGLPRVDFLSHTLAGEKWVDFEWGAQLVYYALYSRLGAAGLLGLKMTLMGLTVWTSLRILTLYGMGGPAQGLAALFLCDALAPVSDLRPDNASILFFNLLPSFGDVSVGPGTFHAEDICGDAGLLRDLGEPASGVPVRAAAHRNVCGGRGRSAIFPLVYGHEKAGSWRDCRRYLALAMSAGVATLLNPHAGDLYAVLREHNDALRILQDVICEW